MGDACLLFMSLMVCGRPDLIEGGDYTDRSSFYGLGMDDGLLLLTGIMAGLLKFLEKAHGAGTLICNFIKC